MILIGKDNFTLDNIVAANSLANGDVITIAPDGALNNKMITYGGQQVIAEDRNGLAHTLTIRPLVASELDKYLQMKYAEYKADSPSYVAMNGTATRRLGDGAGNVVNDDFALSEMTFATAPTNATINTEGDVEQAVREYTIHCLVTESMG